MLCFVCSVSCALFRVLCFVCSVSCALFRVLCFVCSVSCALFHYGPKCVKADESKMVTFFDQRLWQSKGWSELSKFVWCERLVQTIKVSFDQRLRETCSNYHRFLSSKIARDLFKLSRFLWSKFVTNWFSTSKVSLINPCLFTSYRSFFDQSLWQSKGWSELSKFVWCERLVQTIKVPFDQSLWQSWFSESKVSLIKLCLDQNILNTFSF